MLVLFRIYLSLNRNIFKSLFTPSRRLPLYFQLVSERGLSLLGFTASRVKMSPTGLVHSHTFTFVATHYDVWRIRMLSHFRVIDPNIERILDMGLSPPKDPQNLSLEEETNSYLEAQASNVLVNVVSFVVLSSIMPFRNAHDIWTKLQAKYDVSKLNEDDCVPSTSGRDELSSSSTTPTCELSQGNDMVSGDRTCNVDREISIHDSLSLSHFNVVSLGMNM